MQYVTPVSHEPDVLRCAVYTLAVQNGPLEHVTELLPRTEEIGPDEVHHAPVLDQVVLQRVSGQHHAPPRPDVFQGLGGAGMAVLDAVALIAYNNVRTGPRQRSFDS